MSQELQVEVRAIRREEYRAWCTVMGTGFGRQGSTEAAERILGYAGVDRTLATLDGDEIVGTANWFPFEVTMPGLQPLAAASVVSVTVLPSHRRRGVMRSMIVRQLTDLYEAGVPVAILTASEGAMYGRFGYGPATDACTYELDKRVARLARPVSAPGTVRIVSPERAEEVLPAVWDAARLVRPGECTMPTGWWYEHMHDLESRGVDAKRRFLAVYEQAGVVEGLVDYQVVDAPSGRERDVSVDLLVTATPAAYEALFGYLLGVDLTTSLRLRHRPLDEPARGLLVDQRQLRMTRYTDDLWLRPLHVGQLLASRAYAPGAGGEPLRLLVHDELFPANAGIYEIGAGAAGPAPAGAAVDLELDVAALGSLVLGGRRFTTLARAGRVREHLAGAAWRADAMFLPEMEPFATISF